MLPITTWFPAYMKSLYCIVSCWEPGKTYEKNFIIRAMGCFITHVFALFPNTSVKDYADSFLHMEPLAVNVLENVIPRFFRVYPKYYDIMINDPEALFEMCLQSRTSLMNWLYLFEVYIYTLLNKQGHQFPIPTLNDTLEKYDPKDITKTDWGRPTWYLLHTSALFCPGGHDHFKLFHDMLHCLQYLLPCPKCRAHLSQNLQYIDFSNCGGNHNSPFNVELFKCTWNLHNIVNASVNKTQIGFREALRIYSA
jgi:hypothetical protein